MCAVSGEEIRHLAGVDLLLAESAGARADRRSPRFEHRGQFDQEATASGVSIAGLPPSLVTVDVIGRSSLQS